MNVQTILSGGDKRSIGRADEIVKAVLENPVLFQAHVLMMECTYLGLGDEGEETQKFAKERSHIHIKDIEDHIDLFQNQKLVLCHFSRRYKKNQILTRVAKLNETFGNKLEVLAFV